MVRWVALEEFVAAPLEAGVRGCGWAVFMTGPEELGVVLWGTARSIGVGRFRAALDAALGAARGGARVLVDARGLTRFEDETLGAMVEYLGPNRAALAAAVAEVRLAPPRNAVAGSSLAGLFPFAELKVPLRLVEELAIDDLIEEARANERLRVRLGGWLETRLPDPDVDAAAQSLGMSVRTLQRRLQEEATSFREELLAVRLQVAARRLLETDDKITAIALECGFPTSQHFANAFRRAHGATPTKYRAKG